MGGVARVFSLSLSGYSNLGRKREACNDLGTRGVTTPPVLWLIPDPCTKESR